MGNKKIDLLHIHKRKMSFSPLLRDFAIYSASFPVFWPFISLSLALFYSPLCLAVSLSLGLSRYSRDFMLFLSHPFHSFLSPISCPSSSFFAHFCLFFSLSLSFCHYSPSVTTDYYFLSRFNFLFRSTVKTASMIVHVYSIQFVSFLCQLFFVVSCLMKFLLFAVAITHKNTLYLWQYESFFPY